MKVIRLQDEQLSYLLNLIHAEQQFDEESRHICEEDSEEREATEQLLTAATDEAQAEAAKALDSMHGKYIP
jgi:hypothetical protein